MSLSPGTCPLSPDAPSRIQRSFLGALLSETVRGSWPPLFPGYLVVCGTVETPWIWGRRTRVCALGVPPAFSELCLLSGQ